MPPAKSIDLDALSTLTAQRRGYLLATAPESQWFERKSIRVDPKKLAAAIIGMANAEGGIIAVGLSEGTVEGVDDATKAMNRLRQAAVTLVAPPMMLDVQEVEVVDAQGSPNHVALFLVPPGRHAHQSSAGKAFLRVGDSTIELSPSEWRELFYDREADSYETSPVPKGLDTLDSTQVSRLRDCLGAVGNDLHVLRARSLVDQNDRLNIAGLLLVGEDPQRFLPQAVVRVLRYSADEAGTGARQMMMADGDRRLEGPIPRVLDEAIALLDQWAPRRRALQDDGRFGPVEVIPRDVWMEALVNAVVHRSYSLAGDHVRISIFPHRIEVSSPGRFPGIVDEAQPLNIARYARNPRIARVCSDLGYAQELGEGIRRMTFSMRAAGLADPQYQQTSTSVIVRLDATTGIQDDVAQRIGDDALEILSLLRADGPLGTGEIAAALGVARQTAARRLGKLQDEGLVLWNGQSPRDPRAVWRAAGA